MNPTWVKIYGVGPYSIIEYGSVGSIIYREYGPVTGQCSCQWSVFCVIGLCLCYLSVLTYISDHPKLTNYMAAL